ncbi:hypothetical protein BKA82DRAFT_4219814 [Pisolithus tinctorius]|nr:hypothetical protein BKA82DRAFT_4236642 [Pisolithus tinctorius]KAI6139981.1 hypothetical protein BKA82DRAFT_4219814 [Pisolithus tinctorius]
MSNTLISSAQLTVLFNVFHRRSRCCHHPAVFGRVGILNDNCSFLAYYTFFIWCCFGLLVTPGCISYLQAIYLARSTLSGLVTSALRATRASKIVFTVANTTRRFSTPPSRKYVTLGRFCPDARRPTFKSKDTCSRFGIKSSSLSVSSRSLLFPLDCCARTMSLTILEGYDAQGVPPQFE